MQIADLYVGVLPETCLITQKIGLGFLQYFQTLAEMQAPEKVLESFRVTFHQATFKTNPCAVVVIRGYVKTKLTQ